jgi:hypothetical protein
MSKLSIRIQNAIRNQLEVIKKMNQLREQQREAEVAYSNTVGKLTVLSELYEEETGRSLEKDLETDESWKTAVAKIREQLGNEGNVAPVPVETVAAPKQTNTSEKPQQPVARRRAPAKITVDDNPPGPGEDEG